MTLDKAREIIADHVAIAGGYNQTATKMVLGELQKDDGTGDGYGTWCRRACPGKVGNRAR